MRRRGETVPDHEPTEQEAIYFRDAFRRAREMALKDAEAFDEIIYALEGLGCLRIGPQHGLGRYQSTLSKQAKQSHLAANIPSDCPDFHLAFDELFRLVKDARNGAMHEGVFARHLTQHAVELAIIMEHALMNGHNQPEQGRLPCNEVRHYMVRNPECAELWHPLSFIRQAMLKSSYSYLPVNISPSGQPVWKLVSDYALACYLGEATGDAQRERLRDSLQTAIDNKDNKFQLLDPHTCEAGTLRKDALQNCNHLPILVTSSDKSQLLGILTPFDLL